MLDEHEIDLVDIATCTKDHLAHAMLSLKKGFWTLVENPVALSVEDAMPLKGQATKSKNRLIIMQRGYFEPDFMLARQMLSDERLGQIYQIIIRKEDYIRRDDWQVVKRLGGGASYYAMTDLILQALKLLPSPPIQMWSELKRVASLGDAEDYAHLNLKTRDVISADIEFNGGVLPCDRSPSFIIRAERGTFKVEPGAHQGVLNIIDPDYKFPRRRSSVRTPPLIDLHEDFPVVQIPVSLPQGTLTGITAFWKCVYDTVRTAKPFPLQIEDSLEAIKFAHLMKKTSPFGK
jgi:predicted dehydrogenase